MSTIRKFAASLPDVSEAPHHDFDSFRVRGKIFMTIPPGDQVIHIFVPEDVREHALAVHGEFVEKLFWGKKVFGLKIRVSDADVTAVKLLVRQAWAHKAPKALLAKVSDS